jgi:hypothetical protein
MTARASLLLLPLMLFAAVPAPAAPVKQNLSEKK